MQLYCSHLNLNNFRIYYQHNPARLPLCLSTIHALLHIADDIEAMGPVWCYWAFPMERFCGSLLPAIKSRRHPFSSIDARTRDLAALSMIKMIYQPEGLRLNQHLSDTDRQRRFSKRLANCECPRMLCSRTYYILCWLQMILLSFAYQARPSHLLPICE
jgi:hypothetical protein